MSGRQCVIQNFNILGLQRPNEYTPDYSQVHDYDRKPIIRHPRLKEPKKVVSMNRKILITRII